MPDPRINFIPPDYYLPWSFDLDADLSTDWFDCEIEWEAIKMVKNFYEFYEIHRIVVKWNEVERNFIFWLLTSSRISI